MPGEHVQVGFLQVVHVHLVTYCSMTFSMFSRDISVDGRGIGLNILNSNFFYAHVLYQLKNEFRSSQYFTRRVLKQLFYLTPHSSGFFGIEAVKGQRDFRSINCSSTVNEKFHLYFHSYMDAHVWKTTHIAVIQSAPGQENSNNSGYQ